MKTRLLAFVCLLIGTAAHAQVTYTYSGQPLVSLYLNAQIPNTGELANVTEPVVLTGTITLAQRLAGNLVHATPTLISAQFNDGGLLAATSNMAVTVSTDASGNITDWTIVVLAAGYYQSEQALISTQGDSEFIARETGLNQNLTNWPATVAATAYSAPAGIWKSPPQPAPVTPPAATASLGLDCISNTLIAPENIAHFILSKSASGASSFCQYPKNVTPGYYIKVTSNNGSSWTWVTLASLGLGN